VWPKFTRSSFGVGLRYFLGEKRWKRRIWLPRDSRDTTCAPGAKYIFSEFRTNTNYQKNHAYWFQCSLLSEKVPKYNVNICMLHQNKRYQGAKRHIKNCRNASKPLIFSHVTFFSIILCIVISEKTLDYYVCELYSYFYTKTYKN
jgi:hypothetical protein